MSTLAEYQQDTQRLLREAKQMLSNPDDLRVYINRARREVAMRSQAIRRLTPISGPIASCTVTEGGSGYSTSPTITISPPDSPGGKAVNPSGLQATASAIVQGGVIVAIDITAGGDGYFQPTITIDDATGSGCTASLVIPGINLLNAGQEEYKFADIDVSIWPGVDSVYFIRSCSVIYSNYRYSLPSYAFSVYQAYIRQYPQQYQYVPTFCSQFGQGADGSMFFYPLPSQSYQLEFDCQCIPADLVNNQSLDILPKPWSDSVCYFAAHFAMMELQNFNAAKFYLELFEKFAQRYSDYARAGRLTNPYGRF